MGIDGKERGASCGARRLEGIYGSRGPSSATWVVACWVWIDVYLLYNTLGVATDLVSHHSCA